MKKSAICLIFFILLWSFIGIGVTCYGWNITWKKLGVHVLYPPFADMRTVQGSLMSIRLGYNPQINNPGDPWKRVMNYPKIWVRIAKIFRLDNETNFISFVTFYIIAYIGSCFLLLKNTPSVYLLLAMFSGVSLIAVERGNNDILVFVLIFFALYFPQTYFRVILLLLVTVLKIFPFFSIFGLVKKPKIIFILFLVIACYIIGSFEEIKLMQLGNTATGFLSYGFDSMIRLMVQLRRMKNNIDFDYLMLKCAFFSISIGIVIILVKSKIRNLLDISCSTYQKELFVSGGSIFSFTYIISSNWDYRLIFLFFCIPYILSIRKKLFMHITLCCILFSLNVLIIEHLGKYIMWCTMFSKYYLFLIITTFLIKELETYLSTFPPVTISFKPQSQRDAMN